MKIVFPLLVATLAAAGCKTRQFNNDSDTSAFQAGNLYGKSFGISRGEVVITLDDGPGVLSVPLAKYLKRKNAPSVFFLNYRNVGNLTDSSQVKRVKEICELGHPIANHRDTHEAYATSNNVWKNLNDIHGIIKEQCPNQKAIFFRPPGGAWARGSDETGNAAGLNMAYDEAGQNVGLQYIGPVFWDVACDTEKGCNSTDWRVLRDNYFKLIVPNGECKGGIVLAHDIHERTVRALTGYTEKDLATGLAKPFDDSEGLMSMLEKAGCKFVGLDKNPEIIDKLLKNGPGMNQPPPTGGKATVVVPTLLKSAPVDSSKPEAKPVCGIAPGSTLEYTKAELAGAHRKLTLTALPEGCLMNSNEVYIYAPHYTF
jgi:peptidoglycan/xylan/chitin deacetylase (PgdA/CDA1 family)